MVVPGQNSFLQPCNKYYNECKIVRCIARTGTNDGKLGEVVIRTSAVAIFCAIMM